MEHTRTQMHGLNEHLPQHPAGAHERQVPIAVRAASPLAAAPPRAVTGPVALERGKNK